MASDNTTTSDGDSGLFNIEIGDRKGFGIYLDDSFNPVAPEKATLLKVSFDDGEKAFFRVTKKKLKKNLAKENT